MLFLISKSDDLKGARRARLAARIAGIAAHFHIRNWSYVLACQAGWFVCVLSAASGHGAIGFAFAVCIATAHVCCARNPLTEMRLTAAVAALGWVWDSVIAWTRLLAYPNGVLIEGTAPYWIPGLWILLSIQLNTVFRWLHNRPLIAALLGGLAGPLSFRAGATLHAVRFLRPEIAVIVLAAGWSIIFPSLLALSKRWDGVGER